MTLPTSPDRGEWRSDYWGALNEASAEQVASQVQALYRMSADPTMQEARRVLYRDLGLAPDSYVLEAGCGPASALPDLLEVMGTEARIVGIDPTMGFIEVSRARAAELGAKNARYQVGDIRAIDFPDNTFDAAFCDKILIHVGPTKVALGELVRVTRRGGRVGALEHEYGRAFWSTTLPHLIDRVNQALRQARYDSSVSSNLARHFRAVGLVDVQSRAHLGHIRTLREHPFWRDSLRGQIQGAVSAGLLTAAEGQALSADIEELDRRGEFNLWHILHTAVGTKGG